MKEKILRYLRGAKQKPLPVCRQCFKQTRKHIIGCSSFAPEGQSCKRCSYQDKEAGTIMLDVLIGLLIGTVGLGLVLGGIALTTWRAGFAKQDTLKIIQTRNERDKTNIIEINPDTFKDDVFSTEPEEKDE